MPGVAIGILQDGKVIKVKGFGARELGNSAKVDGDIRFMTACNTKALTTLTLAKPGLKRACRRRLSGDRLGDAAATGKVLIKHLIGACTGVPRQDFEWLFEGEKQRPESVMATRGTMRPTSDFGELFQYSNPMAAAAGYIGGEVAYPGAKLGVGYDKAMQALVFDQLGMKHSMFDFGKARIGHYAALYAHDIDHNVQVMGMCLNDTIVSPQPAGAAWSTVNDMQIRRWRSTGVC